MKTKLKQVDPSTLSLSFRTKVAVDVDRNYYIIKNIKSRIIMKDGKKIKEIASTIRNQTKRQVFLATTAPICSKTKTYLKSKNIKIITEYNHD
jgi:hypothetical protein|tara:strand:+ start:209 stop:487 length:279 start_codon:yes stop_codon:yes gene_type:complete